MGAAGLLVLVVAAAVGSERADLGEGRSPVVGDLLGGVLVGGFALLVLTGAWLLLFRRVKTSRARAAHPLGPWWLRSLVMIGLLLIVVVVALLLVGDPRPADERRRSEGEIVRGQPVESAEEIENDQDRSPAFLAGLVLVGLVAVVAIVRARQAVGADEAGDEPELVVEPPAVALQHAVTASLEALSEEPDPRRAILLAYARVLGHLADGGLPRRGSETEREYLERVLRHHGAAAGPARRLTELFEQARYGGGPVDEQMRAEAVAAAIAIRAGIAVPAP